MTTNAKYAVVTGASSGIGAELAEELAGRGYDIVAIARREERLVELCTRITSAGGRCTVVTADLATYNERERVAAALSPNANQIEVLINNAGFGAHGFFHTTDLDRGLELIDVNCAALVHLTKRILPWMLHRKRGYIMNLASVAAFQPGPVMALYYASKAFVLSFSEALSEECDGTGVVVSALCPGTIPTEFQAKAELASSAPPAYASKMSARDVAQRGLDAMFSGRRVFVPAARNRFAIFVNRFLPRRVIVHAVRRIQEARLRPSR
ncbi:MAG: SDR family NAD(P)-dependent oxidoreductase [Gemmatimonadaceae bacterium]